jgi:hypothetical protein
VSEDSRDGIPFDLCRSRTDLRRKPMTSKDRAIRLEAHKLHVVSLLASSRIRNRWASNALLRVSPMIH